MSSYVFITQYVLKKSEGKETRLFQSPCWKSLQAEGLVGCFIKLCARLGVVDVVGDPTESLWTWKCYRFDYRSEKGRSCARHPCVPCRLLWDFWEMATARASGMAGARLHGWMTHEDKTCMLEGSSLHLLIHSGTCTSSCGVQLHRWAGDVGFYPSASQRFSHRKKWLGSRFSSFPLTAILEVRASDLHVGQQAEAQG